jgi:hypothetical protein
MANLMPLVHRARRSVRNREEGNPFATDQVISDLIEALSAAYLTAPNQRVSRAIKVELDLLETLSEPSPSPTAPTRTALRGSGR